MKLNPTTFALSVLFRQFPVPPQPTHTSALLLHYLLSDHSMNVVSSIKGITKSLLEVCAEVSAEVDKGSIDFGNMRVEQRSDIVLHWKVGRYVLRGW